jgi:hypothetical protein
MSDVSKIGRMSDEELLSMQRINLPGNESREAAKTELEYRNAKRMAAFAASTEKSGKRMEFATWVILVATIVQLFLIAVPMIRERHESAPSSQAQATATTASAIKVPAREQVKAEVADWTSAAVRVTCSNARTLPWTSLDGKSKQVTLDCTMQNVTDKALPLLDAKKVDALFHLPDGRVVRGNAYLGSKDHEIPAHGQIEGGLFPGGDNNCGIKQSDSDCVKAELMESHELLLTDKVNGTRYHVLIE